MTPFSGSFNLFIDGDPSASLPLFIQGFNASINDNFSLYIQNDGVSGTFPLFIRGKGLQDGAFPIDAELNLVINRPIQTTFPLYMLAEGTVISGEFPLYTLSATEINDNFELFVQGNNVETEEFPLNIIGF